MDYQNNIIKLQDIRKIITHENMAPMVELDSSVVRIKYLKEDMVALIGNRMIARQSVAEKLISIQLMLDQDGRGYQLQIAYAYRAPEVQQRYFDLAYRDVVIRYPDLSAKEQNEITHSMVANPLVAGHPTGAAVDVTIWDTKANRMVDMGSKIGEFGDVAYTLFPYLTTEQKGNRRALQRFMMTEGFAPFLGEWWHFSYGDKEWACYYRQPYALYDVVPLETAIQIAGK